MIEFLRTTTFNGRVDFTFGIGGYQYDMSNFSSVYVNSDKAVFTGSYIDNRFRTDGIRVRWLTIDSYEEINADGNKRPVDGLLTSVDFDDEGNAQVACRSSWTASGPFSNDVSLTAETVQEFTRTDGQSKYTTGQLVVTAANGLVMTLDADNGDPETFSLTVQDEDVLTQFTLNWTNRNQFFLR